MKKLFKRLLPMLLALAMLLSLTACGGSGTTANTGTASTSGGAAAADEGPLPYGDEGRDEVTLTVFSQLANFSGNQGGWSSVLLKDMFNINLIIIPDVNGAFSTRMESGDLGDIIAFGSNGADYRSAVDKGLLFDWEDEDLLEIYGENILDTMPAALEANRELNSDDCIHGIGHDVAYSATDHGDFSITWDVRWDLYKELGYPEVATLDDMVELFKDMQEICPADSIGNPTYAISAFPDWDGAVVMLVKSLASAYYGYKELGMGLYDPTDGSLHDPLEEDGPYLSALKFFNDLYQNGLLDPDSMTQTYDQMIAKVQRGGTFFSVFNFMGSMSFNTPEHMADGQFMAPLQPSQAVNEMDALSPYGGERIWAIGAKSDNPERAMELINWMTTPDGVMTNFYGIRGLMWDYDENGGTYFTELGQACQDDPSYDLTGVEWTSPYTGKTYTLSGTFNDGMIQINNTTFARAASNPDSDGETFNYTTWASQQTEASSAIEQDWRDVTGFTRFEDYLEAQPYTLAPAANYAEGARDGELDVKWSQVTSVLKTGSWNAIYAKTDAEFDEIVSQMREDAMAYGYDECLAWNLNEAAARFALQ